LHQVDRRAPLERVGSAAIHQPYGGLIRIGPEFIAERLAHQCGDPPYL